MGYPTIRNSITGETGNVDNINVPLPTHQTGDLLIIYLIIDGSRTMTGASGWTWLGQDNSAGSPTIGIVYKVATSSSETSPNIDYASKEQGVYISLAYTTGTYTGTPEISSFATGSGVNPDPPSLTTSWGTMYDTRFIAIVGTDGITSSTVEPTNYTHSVDISTTSGQGASASTAYRHINTASAENPSTFTMDVSETWVAVLIALAGTTPAQGPNYTMSVNVGGTWYNVTNVSVNIGGTWYDATDILGNIGGTWED
jgi:hypothetical protein